MAYILVFESMKFVSVSIIDDLLDSRNLQKAITQLRVSGIWYLVYTKTITMGNLISRTNSNPSPFCLIVGDGRSIVYI